MLVDRLDHSISCSQYTTVGIWVNELLTVNLSTSFFFFDLSIFFLVQVSVRERNRELRLIPVGLPFHNLAAIALRAIFLNDVLTAPVRYLNPSFLSDRFEYRKQQQLDYGIGRDLLRVLPLQAPVVTQSFGFDSRPDGLITIILSTLVLYDWVHLISLSLIHDQGVIQWHCLCPDLFIKAPWLIINQ